MASATSRSTPTPMSPARAASTSPASPPSSAGSPASPPRRATCRSSSGRAAPGARLTMVEINGVAHVMLTVGDWDRSRAFYDALLPFLGLTQVFDGDDF